MKKYIKINFKPSQLMVKTNFCCFSISYYLFTLFFGFAVQAQGVTTSTTKPEINLQEPVAINLGWPTFEELKKSPPHAQRMYLTAMRMMYEEIENYTQTNFYLKSALFDRDFKREAMIFNFFMATAQARSSASSVNKCIYGGNISTVNRRLSPPCEPYRGSCAEGEFECNKTLFFNADGSPLCLKQTASATRECSRRSATLSPTTLRVYFENEENKKSWQSESENIKTFCATGKSHNLCRIIMSRVSEGCRLAGLSCAEPDSPTQTRPANGIASTPVGNRQGVGTRLSRSLDENGARVRQESIDCKKDINNLLTMHIHAVGTREYYDPFGNWQDIYDGFCRAELNTDREERLKKQAADLRSFAARQVAEAEKERPRNLERIRIFEDRREFARRAENIVNRCIQEIKSGKKIGTENYSGTIYYSTSQNSTVRVEYIDSHGQNRMTYIDKTHFAPSMRSLGNYMAGGRDGAASDFCSFRFQNHDTVTSPWTPRPASATPGQQ